MKIVLIRCLEESLYGGLFPFTPNTKIIIPGLIERLKENMAYQGRQINYPHTHTPSSNKFFI